MQATEHDYHVTAARSFDLPYLRYLPEEHKTARKSWPLVLFLHGSGERGTDLKKLERQGLPKLAASGRSFPFVLVAPQIPEGQVWNEEPLTYLLDELETTLWVDRDRVYLTGISMGAFGAWDLGVATPDRFAALLVISGGGNPVEVCQLKDVPVWIVHGRQDDVIPVSWSEALARRLEGCGGNVRLTIYPDAGHDAWSRTYEDPAVIEWLLAQRLP
ncbi:MAG TPA: prolyl oligopeptidase family serine peptidase [Thermoanaerobaculia bacterium]